MTLVHVSTVDKNANLGGVFRTSQAAEAVVAEAREAMADFPNAPSASGDSAFSSYSISGESSSRYRGPGPRAAARSSEL